MKLLDRIAKKLGYVPESTLVKPMIVEQKMSSTVLRSDIMFNYDELTNANDPECLLKCTKRQILANLNTELLNYTVFEIENIGDRVRISGRIRVVNKESEE